MEKKLTKVSLLNALLRITLGLIFFWAFIDKVFGLGFATTTDKSWLKGASPTIGFLKFGTKGPFVEIFQAMAGNPLVDWLFMLGLLFIGLALIFGVGVRIASVSGVILMLLMWLAVLPKQNHPFSDEHIVYALTLLIFTCTHPGRYLGIGNRWSETALVQKHPWLE